MNLAGMHDIEATAIAPPYTWILDTLAIAENPVPKSYPTSLNVITRINHGYGSTGTLPIPEQYEWFAQKVAQYVNGARNCKRWIIGNEPNLSREWPDNTPIYPWHYAECYTLCRQAIHALPSHAQDEVLMAASGPWNAELKYSGNPDGDWILYFEDAIRLCNDEVDGFALHAYTHGYDPALVTSTQRMDWPFENRYYEFYCYRDYCAAIPESLRHLPVYLTECNGNGPWQATGLMPAMLTEIDSWNHSKTPQIHSVIFYRYPPYDDFYIAGRNDVIAEYNHAVALGYESGGATPTPTPPTPDPTPTPTPIEWDARLTQRGCTLQHPLVPDGEMTRKVTIGRWFDEHEAQGRTNIFVRVLDEQGNLAVGVPLTWFWTTGSDTKQTEHKSDPWLASMGLGADYSLDFGMTHVAPSYGIRIDDGHSNDIIDGCGLGSIEQPDYTIHTAYFFEIQLVKASESISPTPIPTPQAKLIWPVVGAVVSQRFGENAAYYLQEYGEAGHNGIDLACPLGTPVMAAADGVVAWIDDDPSGYGNYIRLSHADLALDTFYAHLDTLVVMQGQIVAQGQVIGTVGMTGNATGSHLHYETRCHDASGYHDVSFGYGNGRANPEVVMYLLGEPKTYPVGAGL